MKRTKKHQKTNTRAKKTAPAAESAAGAQKLEFYYEKLPRFKKIIAKFFDAPFRKRTEKHPDEPHFSLVSAFYVWEIYRKATGPRRYFSIAYNVYNSVIYSITALIFGAAVNQIPIIIETHNFTTFIVLLIILLLIECLGDLLRQMYNIVSMRNSNDTFCYVTQKVAEKYINTPLNVREDSEFADKFSRVREFAGTINYISTNLIAIVTSIIGLFAAIASTLVISPFVTLIILVAAIPSSIVSLKIAGKHRINYRRFSKDRRIAWEIERKVINSNSALEIELNGLSENLVQRMVKARRRSNEQDISDQSEFFWPSAASGMIENVAQYGALALIAIQNIFGALRFGDLFSARTLLLNVRNNTMKFFDSISSAAEGLVNATDYMEFIETPERPNGDVVVDGIPTIEFRDVCFTYPKANCEALSHINLTLKPGDSLAIVGANGAGKTTLIKLLIGAYQPTSGVIMVNGLPLERIERKSYLSQIGALFQDYSRYEFATLGENVWFGDIDRPYSKAEIMKALKLAGLEDLPSKFENGLDQILAKDFDPLKPTDLSGGQWQRLCIARAFFRAPNILILDEPTSAVDAQSEAIIFKNIISNQKGKTTLIISHRFSTVRKAKNIIVLDKGKVIESGTHEELIANNGMYKEMFEVQAEGYN